jgi:hypothetical protein
LHVQAKLVFAPTKKIGLVNARLFTIRCFWLVSLYPNPVNSTNTSADIYDWQLQIKLVRNVTLFSVAGRELDLYLFIFIDGINHTVDAFKHRQMQYAKHDRNIVRLNAAEETKCAGKMDSQWS